MEKLNVNNVLLYNYTRLIKYKKKYILLYLTVGTCVRVRLGNIKFKNCGIRIINFLIKKLFFIIMKIKNIPILRYTNYCLCIKIIIIVVVL